jgi:pimeloyl-ACP methyl ester carboxylesterase
VLVGHSYGALVAIDAAARRPGSVRRLVLVDPPGDFTEVTTQMRDEQIRPFITSLETDAWRSTIEKGFDDALVGGTSSTAAAIHARLASMPRDAFASMYRSMMTYDPATVLRRYLAAPGTSAHAIVAPPNAWPFSLHVLVPSLPTTLVPNVSHWIMLDAPERFVAALDAAVDGL